MAFSRALANAGRMAAWAKWPRPTTANRVLSAEESIFDEAFAISRLLMKLPSAKWPRLLRGGQVGVLPGTEAASQGIHVVVSHFSQVVGDEGGAISAAAVADNFRCRVRDFLFDFDFDHAFAQVLRRWDVLLGKFVGLAHV